MVRLNGRLKVGAALLLIFIIVGVVLPRFSPFDPRSWNTVPRNLPPSQAHLLGTTSLGQDTFWLLTFAVQNSLLVGVVVAFFATTIGVLAGLMAGFVGGVVDRVLTLLMDVFIAVPSLPILILMASLLQGKTSLLTISIVLIVFNWPWPARQTRSIALSMREREFINTARFSGASTLSIVVREIFPYVLTWSLANFVNTVLVAIATERRTGDARNDDLLGASVPGAARSPLVVDRHTRSRHYSALYCPVPGIDRLRGLRCRETRTSKCLDYAT
jgi:peptide/nickel transport system permease protein